MSRTTTPYTLKEKFSLKDHLFHREKVEKLASEIQGVYREFRKEDFVQMVLEAFPRLELEERIHHITDMLERHLPKDFEQALQIIVDALPKELDPTRDDDDFGDFIYARYGEYVAKHGVKKGYLERSLRALEEMTKRFSMEFAIRPFFHHFPTDTLEELKRWATSTNYHVRRLASEGSRPRLSWGMKIPIDYRETRAILHHLWGDPTTYVRRSVANHLHDISRDPEYVFSLLDEWSLSREKNEDHFSRLTRHTLRTLIKEGHTRAIEWIGGGSGEIDTVDMSLDREVFSLGETVQIPIRIEVKRGGIFRTGYTVSYPSQAGNIRKKLYSLYEGMIGPETPLEKTIKIPLIHRSTRTLASGAHKVVITIDGVVYGGLDFTLII